MDKPSFTPGPWAVHPTHARVDAFDRGIPTPVCQALWPTDLRSEDETRANAHLIAAAPDLYEALHNALAAGLPDVVAASVRAAIAKAEGRS